MVVSPDGSMQNIAENPEQYYEQNPIKLNRPPVIDEVDETLGEAEHQKKKVRGSRAEPRPTTRRSTGGRGSARKTADKDAAEPAAAALDTAPAAAPGAEAEGEAKPKRRRRGTRGGRRKRAAGSGGEGAGENGAPETSEE
jgi:hypothetical protein